MGYGLIINNVYLNRVTKNELDGHIAKCDSIIKLYRDKLLMLAAATPRSVQSDEDPNITLNWEDHIRMAVDETIEEIERCAIEAHLAHIAKAFPENVVEDY